MRRLESKIQVQVKDVLFGGPKFLSCVPVCSKTRVDFLSDLQIVQAHRPDVLEWRIDYFEHMEEPTFAAETLREAAAVIGDTPLLLTFRRKDEGGYKLYPDDIRRSVLKTVMDTGLVDIVDIELLSEPKFLKEIRDYAKNRNIKLILSWHSMEFTPSVEEMMDRLAQEQKAGADIAKISVQPRTAQDVLRLLQAAYRSRTERVDIPQICISRDNLCAKVVGSCLGSDLAFLGVAEVEGVASLTVDDWRAFYDLCYEGKEI